MQSEAVDDQVSSQFEEFSFDADMPRNDRRAVGNEDDDALTEPVAHKYVDFLNDLFTRAQRRIHDLNAMSNADGASDHFEITSFSPGRESQFKNIQTLPVEKARSLLRAEMLKREHCEKTIVNLNERTLRLEQRLAVTETAEKHYSDLKSSLEKALMQLLDEFASMERKRIERTTCLLEKNEKLERSNSSLATESRNLGLRVEEQTEAIQKLEKELHIAERKCRSLRNQVESQKVAQQTQERDNNELSEKLSRIEREVQSRKEKERKTDERLKELEEANKEATEKIKSLQNKLANEEKLAKEKITEKELDFRRKLDTELEKKRKEQVHEMKTMEDRYEISLATFQEELSRVKRERDGLVAKICGYEKNLELYRQQIYADAQEKLTRGCQLAVSEFVEPENISPGSMAGNPSSAFPRLPLEKPSDRFDFPRENIRAFTPLVPALNIPAEAPSRAAKSQASQRNGVRDSNTHRTCPTASSLHSNVGSRSGRQIGNRKL